MILILGMLKRHCIYGADADLIMLSLSTHEPHFYVIRERIDVEPPKSRNKEGTFDVNLGEKITEENKTLEAKTYSNFVVPFTFVKIFMVRFFLDSYMKNINIPFQYDLENIIDDFVLLCFMVGNDFLPHLPGLDIRIGGIDLLIEFYKRKLGSLNGYLTNHCEINLESLERFIVDFSKCEFRLLQKLEDTKANWVILLDREISGAGSTHVKD